MDCHAKRLERVPLAGAVVRQGCVESGSKLRAPQTLRADNKEAPARARVPRNAVWLLGSVPADAIELSGAADGPHRLELARAGAGDRGRNISGGSAEVGGGLQREI